jgi:hypothetical protein
MFGVVGVDCSRPHLSFHPPCAHEFPTLHTRISLEITECLNNIIKGGLHRVEMIYHV